MQCQRLTKKGVPCERKARPGSKYCYQHIKGSPKKRKYLNGGHDPSEVREYAKKFAKSRRSLQY